MMHTEPLVDAAEAAYLAGDVDRAWELLQRARREGPPTARLLCDIGVVQARRSRYEAARASFERALALDPRCDDARANLAFLVDSGPVHRIRESIIIPAYGRPDAARRVIDELCKQTVSPEEFEVIVVDDGSPEELSLVLDGIETPYALSVVRQENGGPAAARNTGVRRARGDIVLFLNDDAIPAPDLLAVHRQERARAPEHAAILGAFPYSDAARTSRFVRLVEASDLVFPFNELKTDRYNDWVCFWTCNISVPREDIEFVGGFDERFRHAMSEDIELGWRLQRDLGMKVVYAPHAVCRHEHRLDVAEYSRRQHIMGWNHHLLYEKYDNPASLAIGGLGPFDDRAFEALRVGVDRERAEHDRCIAELEAWERDPAGDAADLANILDLAWRVSATGFKRGVCERHFDAEAGRTFHPREKDFLAGDDDAVPASLASRPACFVQVPV